MTTYPKKHRCSLCGTEHDYHHMGSAYVSGSPDLDTRPPETERTAIFTLVQRCPGCGYCASDVSNARPGAETVVKSAAYRRQLRADAYSTLANSFVCKAMVDRAADEYADATWALILAAWACDDEGHDAEAVTCRGDAADMLMIAEDHGQTVGQGEGASTAILVDLLRRLCRLDEAHKAIGRRRDGHVQEVIVRILEYQELLIEQGDTNCHTIAGAFEDEDEGDHASPGGSTGLAIAPTEEPAHAERDLITGGISSHASDMTLAAYHDKWRNGQVTIPEFHRDYVWDQDRAGKLIESFLLGLPVPGVFLYQERTTDKLLVIDGQQRILSAVRFFEGRFGDHVFRLRRVAPKWEGRAFQELSEYDQVRLRDTVLRTTIIEQPDTDDRTSVYHVFERLNSGAAQLNPMEIRRRVYAGEYCRLLERLNGNTSWRAIIGSDRPDRRLHDEELILRFFAMRDGWETYEEPMRSFLNEFIDGKSQIGEADMELLEKMFDRTCAEVLRQLGKKPFHLRRHGLAPSLLDTVMVMMSLTPERGITDCRERYESLLSDDGFMQSVVAGANDSVAVRRRFERARQVILGIGSGN